MRCVSFGQVALLSMILVLAAGRVWAQPGNLDPSFAQTGSGLNNDVNSIAQQTDSKIIIGGGFQNYDITPAQRIARLNSDGSLDNSFTQTGTGLGNVVYSAIIQPDGKIVAGGFFTDYNGIPRQRMVRLNADGSLDPSFTQVGGGLNGVVFLVVRQPDGKFLVGGGFTTYNGASSRLIARLNSDGSLDPSFSTTGAGLVGGSNSVSAISLQPDGKIIVGGTFTTYNGIPRSRIARLNSDGTLDNSFIPTGSGFNGIVYKTILQPDGKILAVGNFTSFNGSPRPYIARLNTDGSLDPTFVQVGSGLDNSVYGLAQQSDGKIIVVGDFTAYNGSSRSYVARLNMDGSLDATFSQTGTGLNLY